MSFDKRKDHVEEGDTVMLYLGRQQLTSIVIDIKKTHQTKFGAFPHKDFIGRKFGTKVHSKNGRGWVFILHPTPELWTVTLPHRTQILYTTDISLITLELELKPGSIVIESGTGSGSLSHAIIRTIKPNGHLHTFDFHQQRVEKAEEEFKCHNLDNYVTVKCADACKDGFQIENKADAVFLDLPAPYDAIPHAKKALKKSGGRICSFSPCIEQVQRTCDVLRQHRFCEIKTLECLLRPMTVRTVPFPEPNLGPETIQELKEKQQRDHENRQKYRKNNDVVNKSNGEPESKKQRPDNEPEIKKEQPDSEPETQKQLPDDVPSLNNNDTKNVSRDTTIKSEEQMSDTKKYESITGMSSSGMVSKMTAKEKAGFTNVLTSKPGKEMPGHTGYLTFASLYPEF